MSDGAPFDPNEMNKQVIADFRANDGVVGGMFEGIPILILHSTGAKSGKERLNPLAYQDLGGRIAIFASKAGATTHPDWYYNVVANPKGSVELGTESFEVNAVVVSGDERTAIWDTQKANQSAFAEYEKTAGDREIPVVVLERA
ncbi:MAG: nitroreductase family deazaflavin-dependent oxidoreductase [Acidimicrobiia bacterium]|nr:nitroreductase family deazaflavin-dependent oxidoreductase [Acidimicrobiia bacterium]